MRIAFIGISFVLISLIGIGTVRACDDKPGTPDQVVAVPISQTSINLVWRNTTSKSGGSNDVWFDIYVRDGSGHPLNPSMDITGGAERRGIKFGQMSSYIFNGLAPGREYQFQMRARDGAGTSGCVSAQASAIAIAWTPTPQIDAKCTPYASRALQQVTLMKSHGPMTAACDVIFGARWNPDRNAHYEACTEGERNHQPDFTVGETAARDDTIKKCVPSSGACTRAFIQWRAGNDLVPLEWCQDIMGLNKYCADHGSYVAVSYPPSGGRGLFCAPFSKQDSLLDQTKHIIRGVEQGTADAFVAVSPFLGPVSEGLACVNGVIYACAILALDTVQLATKNQISGIAGDATVIATQAENCANGNVGACAQIGARGAARAGLNIPGKDATTVATAAQKCNEKDNNACIELGQDAVDAAGLKTH